MSDQQPGQDQHKPSLLQTIQSILAALFGVQSNRNRERDFNHGDAGNYIGVYIVLVIALVVTMAVVVNLVLDAAGK